MRSRWCPASALAILIIFLYICCLFETSNCAQLSFGRLNRRTRRHLTDNPSQKDELRLLELLKRKNVDYETMDKRRIDFGTGRDHAGREAARHLIGLAYANLPTGPGRRRRKRRVISNTVNF